MKAIQVAQTGGPEVLTLVNVPEPAPKANEAVVKIEASGVNFIDVYHRTGLYPLTLPSGLGGEGAGVITLIRRIRLVAEQRDHAGVVLLTQRLDDLGRGLAAADDDEVLAHRMLYSGRGRDSNSASGV